MRIKLRVPGATLPSLTVPASSISTDTITAANNFGAQRSDHIPRPGPAATFTSALVDARVDGDLMLVREDIRTDRRQPDRHRGQQHDLPQRESDCSNGAGPGEICTGTALVYTVTGGTAHRRPDRTARPTTRSASTPTGSGWRRQLLPRRSDARPTAPAGDDPGHARWP